MYEIETRKHEPKNVFAGDFPTLPESGTAGAAVAEYMPVAKNTDGKIVPVTADTIADVVGISAAEAAEDEPIVYYMTGEFFADGLTMPAGVTVEAVKDALRKISIFLR
ncbi:hypothetical protein [Mediterraneibacter gnavus]|uniref:hypothetical protein n=1 Tax=Mediterraneibacter gnavus TaxID=33038 RepID=UPI0035628BEE